MKKIAIFFLIGFTLSKCGIYSFSGASIPLEAKTISVDDFSNKASIVQPTLSQTVTDKLKDLLSTQTNLMIVEKSADLVFQGSITKYNIQPISIKANETSEKNRLTITINVTYINNIDSENEFETSFSRYIDYASNQNFIEIEETLIEEVTNEITEDIFNKAFVNW
tara:strand:+ start:10 stop:507 length:498 start_codon:yes stop_codon:yes gene_type:complete